MNKHIDLNIETLETIDAPLFSNAEMLVIAHALGLIIIGGVIIT